MTDIVNEFKKAKRDRKHSKKLHTTISLTPEAERKKFVLFKELKEKYNLDLSLSLFIETMITKCYREIEMIYDQDRKEENKQKARKLREKLKEKNNKI